MARGRDLAGADLRGEDLRESHLARADLTGTKLRGANLHGVDLRGACLRDAELDGADLRDALVDGADFRFAALRGVLANGSSFVRADLTLADLAHADLRSADLSEALLTDANLSAAALERANLSDANLIGAELADADLRRAILCGANLRDAHLDGADFAGARFAFTVLAASDLSRARGLESAVHDGPSTVGIDAFLLSRGEIPDAFLAGSGLSPLTIEYLKSVAAAEEGMLVGDALFLVFAETDRARARRLRAYLRMSGHQTWYWQERAELSGRHNRDRGLRVRFGHRLVVLLSSAGGAPVAAGVARAIAEEEAERRPIVVAVRVGDPGARDPTPRRSLRGSSPTFAAPTGTTPAIRSSFVSWEGCVRRSAARAEGCESKSDRVERILPDRSSRAGSRAGRPRSPSASVRRVSDPRPPSRSWRAIRAAVGGELPPPRRLGAAMTIVHRECAPGRWKGEVRFERGGENSMGIIHGGSLASILDVAMGYASLSLLDENESQRTLEIKINFLRGVPADVVTAEGEVLRRGKRTSYCEGSVRTSGGDLVARASATFAIRRSRDPWRVRPLTTGHGVGDSPAMPTLYEHPLSPYAQKVKIALDEKAIAFESRMPNFFGEDPDFAAASPRREVPCLVDGDVRVFDSTIILEYLEDKWPKPPLLPATPAERARVRMIEELCDTYYEAINWGVYEVRVFRRATGALAEQMLARAARQIAGVNARLARELGERRWFNGEVFGWGDLAVVPYVNAAAASGNPPPEGSALARWLARCVEREAVKRTLAAAAESMAGFEQVSALIESGAFVREYRDHRLEWMMRSGGKDIVLEGMARSNIRFSVELD